MLRTVSVSSPVPQEDDQLTALVKAMFFADPSISLNKATRQAAAKYKSLGMTPPSVVGQPSLLSLLHRCSSPRKSTGARGASVID